MALSLLGLGYLFGRVGLAAGVLVGPVLPPGANATLLRSTAFFDSAGGGAAVAVLTCWAVAGAALVVAALRRRA